MANKTNIKIKNRDRVASTCHRTLVWKIYMEIFFKAIGTNLIIGAQNWSKICRIHEYSQEKKSILVVSFLLRRPQCCRYVVHYKCVRRYLSVCQRIYMHCLSAINFKSIFILSIYFSDLFWLLNILNIFLMWIFTSYCRTDA